MWKSKTKPSNNTILQYWTLKGLFSFCFLLPHLGSIKAGAWRKIRKRCFSSTPSYQSLSYIWESWKLLRLDICVLQFLFLSPSPLPCHPVSSQRQPPVTQGERPPQEPKQPAPLSWTFQPPGWWEIILLPHHLSHSAHGLSLPQPEQTEMGWGLRWCAYRSKPWRAPQLYAWNTCS